MRLNHLNLCVDNVPESRCFFETHFGFRCIELKGDGSVAVPNDESGFTLALSEHDRSVKPDYPEAFHIGFLVESHEEVSRLHRRLASDGVKLHGTPQKMRGVFGFYGDAPGNVLFEVSSHESRCG